MCTSQENLGARRASVVPEQLRAWDDGPKTPTLSQLRAIANAYKRSVNVFFLRERPTPIRIPREFRKLELSAAGAVSPELTLAIREPHAERDSALDIANGQAMEFGFRIHSIDVISIAKVRIPRRRMMNVKGMAAFIVAFTSSSVLAQASHLRAVMFGDEVVTLKFSNIPSGEERQKLWDATNEAIDPVEQERLWRNRWEDYGEATALQSLAIYHLERGDLVSGYAHLYAVDKLAEWYESVATDEFKPAPGQGKYHPPGPLLRRHFAEIEADMELVGKELTASQRKAGVKLAATLIRNNPNCCT